MLLSIARPWLNRDPVAGIPESISLSAFCTVSADISPPGIERTKAGASRGYNRS